jgi:hypothetical protein
MLHALFPSTGDCSVHSRPSPSEHRSRSPPAWLPPECAPAR